MKRIKFDEFLETKINNKTKKCYMTLYCSKKIGYSI